MLVVANIWDDVDDESLIEEFSRVVTTSKTGMYTLVQAFVAYLPFRFILIPLCSV